MIPRWIRRQGVPLALSLLLALHPPFAQAETAGTAPRQTGDAALADPLAFTRPSANLGFENSFLFNFGNRLFRKDWASSSDSQVPSGLGPLYNAPSCHACHLRDGRGQPFQAPGQPSQALVLRLSVPATGQADMPAPAATRPDPVYGVQIQGRATAGHSAEFRLGLSHTSRVVRLSGGAVAHLARPQYRLSEPAYGALNPDVTISPRIAPQMIGLGLLEAVPEADILALADPDDRDGDGISGRAMRVWSPAQGRPMLGRFGLRAETATLLDQTARAFAFDMGLSSPLFPDPAGDCTPAQRRCRAQAGAGADLSMDALRRVAFYSRNLAVPARRGADRPLVRRGEGVFHRTGCAACHRASFVTDPDAEWPEQRGQRIWPYTDMLLHDMGPDLADDGPDGMRREWRTPPLWGIGLTRVVSGHDRLLHDGRARGLLEAILWHGGEAAPHRDRVIAMPPADRAALIAFLESL